MAGLTAFAFLSRVVSNVGALSSSVRLINLPSRRLVGQKLTRRSIETVARELAKLLKIDVQALWSDASFSSIVRYALQAVSFFVRSKRENVIYCPDIRQLTYQLPR